MSIFTSLGCVFNGGAGSGESEIRRWLLENDLVEAIVALPTEIFFRTGIGTYLWILSNKKPEHRRQKVQLLNASDLWTSIKNEGNKRRMISDEQIRQIVDLYSAFDSNEFSRVVDYRVFGYRRIKVLRPLRMALHVNANAIEKLKMEKAWAKLTSDQQAAWIAALQPHIGLSQPFAWAESFVAETVQSSQAYGKGGKSLVKALINALGERDPAGEPVLDANGDVVPDPDLSDNENVPLTKDIKDYFAQEVLTHLPDAYIDESFRDEFDKGIGRVGYEINFNRFFYKYVPPRKLVDIDADLKQVEAEIAELLGEVTE